MKLLLTGATGFVGRNFLLTALRTGRYEKIFVSVRDEAKLRRQFSEEGFAEFPSTLIPLKTGEKVEACDEVIHCAGVLFERDRNIYHAVNVEGTLRLIESLQGSPRILIVSSQSAGGATPKDVLSRNEKHPDAPLTWYGESKRDMENALFEKFPHLPIVVVRPPMVLGARDTATLPLFQMAGNFLRVKSAWHPKFYSWIAVNDFIAAFFSVLEDKKIWAEEGRRLFYVAASAVITDQELISTAAKVMGRNGVTVPIPQVMLKLASHVVDASPALRKQVPSLTRDRAREIWPSRMVIDPSAFAGRFDWSAKASLEATLQETWAWYSAKVTG
ncbi:MAG: NAD(P)-dependent oxidoreductase [Chthoniobacterales bacterium]